jgi:PAS domain S-box-containing protein
MNEQANKLSLFDSKGYFEALANVCEDIITIVEPKNFTLQYINRLNPGFKLEELIGVEVFNFVYPEHIEAYRKVLNEVVSSHQSKVLQLETLDHVNENGKAWYSCSISPLINQSNVIESIIIIAKDITASKLQEIEIHNKEEKLYAIINNTKDMIMSIDKDLNIMEYNTVLATLVERGYGKKNLTGTSILNYLDPRKEQGLRKIYDKVFKGEVVNDVDRFNTASGDSMFIETSYHPIKNFEQEVTGISIFSKDITERILSEEKLKSTLKDREVLLSEIHHRIKNNLALVSSMLQLKEMNLNNEEAKAALVDSRKRVKTTALVHEMLYRNESFNNIELMKYIPELFRNVNFNDNIKLDLKGDDFTLVLNKALPFCLMLHELMMNSFKHSFNGAGPSMLKIRTRIKDDTLTIEYFDSSGTFPDTVDFNDTSTTGLMLIHTFVEQLGGKISLISKMPPSYLIEIPIN